MGKIIAVSTNKGGVLKTSITCNLAGLLAQEGKKVLIVDTDNQGNVVLSFGKNPDECDPTIYDVLINALNPKKAIIKVHQNIDVIPSNDAMEFFEFDVLTNLRQFSEPFYLLRNGLDNIDRYYDYILVDSPPNLGLTQGNILSYVDEVLIPYQAEVYSMRSLIKMLSAVKSFKKQHNPKLKIAGVVATLVDLRTILHSEALQECRKFCFENGIKMFETVIPRSIQYPTSIAIEKKPLTLTKPKKSEHKLLIDVYKELWGEIVSNE